MYEDVVQLLRAELELLLPTCYSFWHPLIKSSIVATLLESEWMVVQCCREIVEMKYSWYEGEHCCDIIDIKAIPKSNVNIRHYWYIIRSHEKIETRIEIKRCEIFAKDEF